MGDCNLGEKSLPKWHELQHGEFMMSKFVVGWGELTHALVPWRQGFRHPTRNECMGWFAQICQPHVTLVAYKPGSVPKHMYSSHQSKEIVKEQCRYMRGGDLLVHTQMYNRLVLDPRLPNSPTANRFGTSKQWLPQHPPTLVTRHLKHTTYLIQRTTHRLMYTTTNPLTILHINHFDNS